MSMSKSRGSKVATEMSEFDDELSLDDLDRVVGGSDALPRREEGDTSGYSYEEGSTAAAATVHAPADLPPALAAIESHVADDSWTGQQAVHEITTLIGQTDHSIQVIAGVEIATIIGRGELTATQAMTEIHSAVTSHAMTGEQAIGLLAGVIFGQYSTDGIDQSVGAAARAEIASLVSGNHITAADAITALAATAGEVSVFTQNSFINTITTLATDHGLTPAQVADDISAALNSGHTSGTEVVGVLTFVAAASWDPATIAAMGAEIGQLVAEHKITAEDVIAGVHTVGTSGWMYGTQAAEILVAAVDASSDLAGPAGTEIGALLTVGDNYNINRTTTLIGNMVTSHTLTADEAIVMLSGMAGSGHGANAAAAIVNVYSVNHLSVDQVIADIHGAVVADALDGAAALTTLMALQSNTTYGAAFAPAVGAEIVALISAGEVTAAQAIAPVAANVEQAAQYLQYGPYYESSFRNQLNALMAIAAIDAPGMDGAVTAALQHLIATGYVSASTVVSTMASQMGVGNNAGPVTEQVIALINANALTAEEAVTALAMGTNVSMAPKQQIADAIEALIDSGKISAGLAMNMIASTRYTVGDYTAVNLMAILAGQDPAFIAGAASMIRATYTDAFPPSSALWAIHQAISLNGMPVDQGIALMSQMVGIGNLGTPALDVGTEIALLISQNKISDTQAMADLHAAVVNRSLGADAAVVLLASAAIGASSATLMAISGELNAMVSAGLLTAAQLAQNFQDLRTYESDNTALMTAVGILSGATAAPDPSAAVFTAINTSTNATTLNSAADQLYTMITGGQTTVQHVMETIDQALAANPPTMTNAQAMALVIGIGGHSDLAVQNAAGVEMAKLLAASGPLNNTSWIALQSTLGEALNAGTITDQEALGMLIGAISAPGSTELARSTARDTLANIVTGYWGATYYYRAPLMQSTFGAALESLLTAGAISGEQALRTAFVMTGSRIETAANTELASLVETNKVSMTAVHTAITSGWWQIDGAVMTLAGMSEQPAAMNELMSLVSGGDISVSRLIADVHSAFTGPRTTSVDDAVRVLGAIAATGTTEATTAVANELLSIIKNGQVNSTQIDALIDGAGANGSTVVNNVLGQLGSYATNIGRADVIMMGLISAGATTLDHALAAISSTAGMTGVSTVLNLAVLYDGLSTADANAAIVAMVGAGTISANDAITLYCKLSFTLDAGAGIQALIANGNISATSAINAIVMSPDLTRISAQQLLATFASSTDPSIQSAVCGGILNLNYGSPTPDQTALTLLNMATQNATWGPAIAGHLMFLVNNGGASVAMIDAMIGYAMDHGVPAANALPIIAQVGAQVPAADRAAFFNDITAMVTDGRVTAAAAIAVLSDVSTSSSDPTLQQLIGAQIQAIMQVAGQDGMLDSIATSLTNHSMTGDQAAALLIGMTTSWNVPANVVQQIGSLVANNLLTPAQVTHAVDNAITAGTLTAAGGITVLANCVGANASLSQAVGDEIALLISGGKITAQQAMITLNGTINHPLNMDQWMGLMAGMTNNGLYDGRALNTAIATNIATLVYANGIQIADAVNGIRHAVVAGTITADEGVTLLAGMAAQGAAAPETEFRGAELHDAAVAAMAEVASGGLNSFNSILASFGPDMAANMALLTEIAGHANAAFQAQYGSYIAQQVATGAMTSEQALAAVNQLNIDDTITPEQALRLYANISAAVAQQPNASELNGPLNTAISALVSNMTRDDDHMTGKEAIAILQELRANGGYAMGLVATDDINMLLEDPRTLIASAVQLGMDMNEAGAKIAAMVNAGQLTAWEAVSNLNGEIANQTMTGAHAVTFLLSIISHGTADGWAVNQGTPGQTSWQQLASIAFGQFENYGVPPATIMAGIHAAFTSHDLSAQQSIILLAGLIGNDDLRSAADDEIAAIIASRQILIADATAAIIHSVSLGYANPGVLTPTLAADALVEISAAFSSYIDIGDIGASLVTIPGLSASQLVDSISAAIAAHDLSGTQALSLLRSVANSGDSAVKGEVGQALATLVESDKIALSDVRNAIGPYFNVHTAIVVLTAMIGLTDGVVDEISALRTQRALSAQEIIADVQGAMSARTFFGEGATVKQVMAVLATLPITAATDIISAINTMQSQNLLGSGSPIAGLAEAAGEGTADMQRTVAAVFAGMMGPSSGSDLRFSDAITALVPGALTAEQAIAVFAAMSAATATGMAVVGMDYNARAGIMALINAGHVTASAAMTDIVGGLTSGLLTADQTVALIAGVATQTNTNGGVLTAAGAAFNALFNNGQISVTAAMATLDRALAFQWMSQTGDNAAIQATYDAGGLTATSAPVLLAAILATSTQGGVHDAVSAELMTMVNTYRITSTEAMNAIHGAVASGGLTAEQALHALALIEPGPNTDMQTAIATEMSALITSGLISATDAVAALAAMANTSLISQELAAGHAIGSLVAQGTITTDQAIAGIQNALDTHALAPNNAIAALIGLSVGGSDALRDAAHDAIVSIASADPARMPGAFTYLESVAGQSDVATAASVGNALAALVGGHVLSATDAMGLVHQAGGSMTAVRFFSMLSGIAGGGDLALQVAAGGEMAALGFQYGISLPTNAFDGIDAAVADGSLSASAAVVMLAAAIQAMPYVQIQTRMADVVAGLVENGRITPADAMSGIYNAVAEHALTAEQAFTAMAYISEAGTSPLRLAVVAEVEHIVSSGAISGPDALTALIHVASRGTLGMWDGAGNQDQSITLQCLTGGMLAKLIDAGHLTAAQVASAISSNTVYDDSHGYFGPKHAVALMMGVGVNGGAEAKDAAGEAMAALVRIYYISSADVVAMFDRAIVDHTISSGNAVATLLNFAAALPSSESRYYPIYLVVAAEVKSLAERGLIGDGAAYNAIMSVAIANPDAALAAGASLGVLWANNTNYPVNANSIPAALEAAVRNGDMTAAEAVTLAMGIGIHGRTDAAGGVLAHMIAQNVVTAEQVVATLAGITINGTTTELTTIGKELAAAMPADQAATMIGNLIEANTLTVQQGVRLLAAFAEGSIAAQVAAGNELASLIEGGLSATDVLWPITSAVSQGIIRADHAVLMLASAVLGGSEAVQAVGCAQIRQLIVYQSISAVDAMAAIRAGVAADGLTLTEAMTAQITFLARYSDGPFMDAFAADVAAQIAAGSITANRAISMLAEIAGNGSTAVQVVVGQEIGTLIAGGFNATAAISQIHAAITSNVMSATEAMAVLAAISTTAGLGGQQTAITGEVAALIAAGLITADQAVAGIIGAIPPFQQGETSRAFGIKVVELLVAQSLTSSDLRNAIGAGLGHGIADGRVGYGEMQTGIARALAAHVITANQQLGLWVTVAASGDAETQNQLHYVIRDQLYTRDQEARLHLLGALAAVAGSGGPELQVYVGQELARLSSLQVWMPVADINTAIRTAVFQQTMSGVEAVNVLAALYGATAGPVHASAIGFIVQLVLSSYVSAADAVDAFRHSADFGAMTPDQALEGLFVLYQIGTKEVADDITHEIVELITENKTTLAAVTERVQKAVHDGAMTSDAAVEFLSGLAWIMEPAARPQIAEAVAEIMLKDWGITVENPMYADLVNGIKEVTLQVAQLGHGLTAQQVINNLTQYAEAHAVPADVLLVVLMHEAKGVAPLLPAAAALAPMVATIVNDHLQAGTTQQHLAAQIVNGRFSADAAEAVLTAMATDLWSMTQHLASTDLLLQAATDILHVEVAVQTVAPQVLSGQMSGTDALNLLISKVGNTAYALDIGLQHLATLISTIPPISADYLHPELSGATPAEIRAAEQAHDRAEVAQGQVLQYIADRALWGGMAASMIDAMNHGLISVGDAIAFTQATCTAGRTDDNGAGALVDDIGMVRLLQAAPAGGGLAYALHHNDALVQQMTTGISALMLLDSPNLAQNVATAQALFQDHIYNTVGWPVPGAPYTPDPVRVEEEGNKSQQWYESAWSAMRSASGTADTFGSATSLTINSVSRFSTGDLVTIGAATAIGGMVGFPLAGPIVLGAALGHDTLEGYVRFGATMATQGIPGVSAIAGMPTLQGMFINEAVNTMAGEAVTVGVEVPAWAMEAMGNYAPEFLDDTAMVNLSPAAVFTAVSITSATLPLLLKVGAISETLAGGSEMLSGACGVVSATCQLITGTITGTVVTAGVSAFDAMSDMAATFRDIGGVIGGVTSVDSLSHSAQSLGENLFSVMYGGMDVNAVINAGVDTGQFMVSLFSGNTAALAGDAQAMGESLFNLVTSNRYVQMFTDKVLNFADTVEEAANLYMEGMDHLAHSAFGEAIWNGWTSLF